MLHFKVTRMKHLTALSSVWYTSFGYHNPTKSCLLTATISIATLNERRSTLHIGTGRHIYAHHDVIKWKHFPRYRPFVRGIQRTLVNSPHKGQWRGALMFSLICVCINGWVNNRGAGDLRRYRAHYDVTVMISEHFTIGSSNVINYWTLKNKLKLSLNQNNTVLREKLYLNIAYKMSTNLSRNQC